MRAQACLLTWEESLKCYLFSTLKLWVLGGLQVQEQECGRRGCGRPVHRATGWKAPLHPPFRPSAVSAPVL